MYVACRELELQTRKAMPGDQVPEALDWSYPILLAHLNLGWLKYVGDGADAHSDDKQSSSSTTIQTKKKTSKAPEKKAQEGECKCEQCDKTFKTARALKIHVTTAHKK